MSLSSMVVKATPTSYTVTGGTAISLASSQNTGTSQRFGVTTDESILNRRTLDITYSEPKPAKGAPNGYSQERFNAFLKTPKVLDNGNRTIDTVKLTFACDVETSVAEKTAQLDWIAQLCLDASFRAAYINSSVA